MEIIEPRRYVKKCPCCKTELVYTVDDIRISKIRGWEIIVCPVCYEHIKLNKIFKRKYKPSKQGECYETGEKRKIGFRSENEDDEED